MAVKRSTAQALEHAIDRPAIEAACRAILIAIGEDPDREGLRDTPARYARFWNEFSDHDPGNYETVFDMVNSDQLVAVSGIKVWSLCEHHLLPFHCTIAIGYIPDGKMLGLSKFARIAIRHAHKLQVQERLVTEIATDIRTITGSKDIAVIGSGEHLCMTMRGIQCPAMMHSSVMWGRFRESGKAREEFLRLTRP